MNLIKAVKVQVSPPPISVLKLHSQTDKISFVGPITFPKFWGKKAKAATRMTLYEPPNIFKKTFFTACSLLALASFFQKSNKIYLKTFSNHYRPEYSILTQFKLIKFDKYSSFFLLIHEAINSKYG